MPPADQSHTVKSLYKVFNKIKVTLNIEDTKRLVKLSQWTYKWKTGGKGRRGRRRGRGEWYRAGIITHWIAPFIDLANKKIYFLSCVLGVRDLPERRDVDNTLFSKCQSTPLCLSPNLLPLTTPRSAYWCTTRLSCVGKRSQCDEADRLGVKLLNKDRTELRELHMTQDITQHARDISRDNKRCACRLTRIRVNFRVCVSRPS